MSQICYTNIMIPNKNNISTVTDMRRDAIGLLKDVQKKGMKYIFQNSKPMAILLSMKTFEKMIKSEEDMKKLLIDRVVGKNK